MRQTIQASEWMEAPENARSFIATWKRRKGYLDTPTLTLGMCIEFLLGISNNFHIDYGDSHGRFYNNILINKESVVGWEGEELIAILWYEIIETIKKRIAASGTHNYTLPE